MIRNIASNLILVTLLCVLAIGGVATLWWNSSLAVWPLNVATGPALEGGVLGLSAINQVFAEEEPHVRLHRIQNDNMAMSAKALENGTADLAVVRSDILMPKNGLTVAILRRDSLVLIVPAHSHITSLQNLAGKKIGILKSGAEEEDRQLEHLLDAILNYYNISPGRVGRELLSFEETGEAVTQKRVVGILALGPVGPGLISKVIASITHATKSPPELIGDKQAAAIAKQLTGVESNDIEAGAFGGASPRPEEDLTTLAVTYRLVAKYSLPDFVVGEVARILFLAKARLISVTPIAMQIEEPDSDDKNEALPVHPGAAAFFSGEQTSLVDSATNILYLTSIVLGVFGSGFAWLLGSRKKPIKNIGRMEIDRLIEIMREARNANPEELDKFEDEIDTIVSRSLGPDAETPLDADQLKILSIVVHQARQALNRKRNITN